MPPYEATEKERRSTATMMDIAELIYNRFKSSEASEFYRIPPLEVEIYTDLAKEIMVLVSKGI